MEQVNYKFMLKKLNSKPDQEFEFFRILDNQLRASKELSFSNQDFVAQWDSAFTTAAIESKNKWLEEFRNGSDAQNKKAIDNVFLKEYINFWRA